MSSTLQHLYDRNIGLSWEKQYQLFEWAAELDWEFDLDAGEFLFSDGSRCSIQVLGTESEVTGTWLWGWANQASEFSDDLLRMGRRLRQHGETSGIVELVTAELELEDFDGRFLTDIASGVCNAAGYYRCPIDGGALFVLFDDERLFRPTNNLKTIAGIFSKLIANSQVANHRLALESYLTDHQLDFEEELSEIRVKDETGNVLVATFDSENRFLKLDVNLQPVK